MTIRRVLITFNNRPGSPELARQIQGELSRSAEVECVNVHDLQGLYRADLAFSIGGDGTVLGCLRALEDCGNTPVIAVSMGTVGFITEVRPEMWKEVYDRLRDGQAALSRRRLLSSEVKLPGGEWEPFADALNDIVITNKERTKILNLEMTINGRYAGALRSDGVIVASPTGSTAYSMAAGGPILDPEMEAMVISPICPFTLSNRPVVVGGNSVVEFGIPGNQSAEVAADGQMCRSLAPESQVRVSCAGTALLAGPGGRSFIEVVRRKLHWDGGINA